MPRLSQNDPISKALASFRRVVAEIEERNDPDEIADLDGAVWDVAITHKERRQSEARKAPRDSGMIPAALAVRLADGSWRVDQ